MRIFINAFTKIMRWPVVTVFYVPVLLCISAPVHGTYVFLGIEPGSASGSVDYIAFSRWMLMMSAPLIVNGFFLERSKRVEIFTRLRMKWSEWSLYLLGVCAANATLWVLAVCALAISKGVGHVGSLLVVLWTNCLLWMLIAVMLYFLSGEASWSGVAAIAVVGGTFLVGEHIQALRKYLPGSWGMLCRSALSQSGGYSLTYMTAMNLLLCAVCAGIHRRLVCSIEA